MDISSLFQRSWKAFSANMGMAIGVYVVGAIVGGILGALTLGIAAIPVLAGMYKSLRKAAHGGAPEFNDLFSEFSNFAKWFMLWVVLIGVVIVSAITFGLGGIV